MSESKTACPNCRKELRADDITQSWSVCDNCDTYVHAQSDLARTESHEREIYQALARDASGEGDYERIVDSWRPGDLILDRYEVREVFSGGMGFVYRVYHRR